MALTRGGRTVLGWMVMDRVRDRLDPECLYFLNGGRFVQHMGIFRTGMLKSGEVRTTLAHEGESWTRDYVQCKPSALLPSHMETIAQSLATGVDPDMASPPENAIQETAFGQGPIPQRIPTSCYEMLGHEPDKTTNGRIIALKGRYQKVFDGMTYDFSDDNDDRRLRNGYYVTVMVSECAWELADWSNPPNGIGPTFQWGNGMTNKHKRMSNGDVMTMTGILYEGDSITCVAPNGSMVTMNRNLWESMPNA